VNRSFWQRLVREPLLHFLILGAGIYFVYSHSATRGTDSKRVVVSAGQIQNLASIFARTRMRPPTGTELRALIDDHVREEILAREAAAQGLDRDDPIIKRRLRQKMEFVAEDLAADLEPTEAQLQAFLAANASKFSTDASFSFRQVYFSPEKRGNAVMKDAASLLAKLVTATDKAGAAARGGDRLSMIEAEYKSLSTREVAEIFGDGFAAGLRTIEPGKWSGPIQSGYGLHLVYVEARTASALPPLARVRDTVLREWHADRAADIREAYFRKLLAEYQVVIQPPPATEKTATP